MAYFKWPATAPCRARRSLFPQSMVDLNLAGAAQVISSLRRVEFLLPPGRTWLLGDLRGNVSTRLKAGMNVNTTKRHHPARASHHPRNFHCRWPTVFTICLSFFLIWSRAPLRGLPATGRQVRACSIPCAFNETRADMSPSNMNNLQRPKIKPPQRQKKRTGLY